MATLVLNPTKDTKIDSAAPTSQFIDALTLWGGWNPGGSHIYHAIVSFVSTGWPVILSSATLRLTAAAGDSGGGGDTNFSFYLLMPANLGWLNNKPSWNHKNEDDSTAWAGGTNGCGVIGTDVYAAPIVTYSATSLASGETRDIDVLTLCQKCQTDALSSCDIAWWADSNSGTAHIIEAHSRELSNPLQAVLTLVGTNPVTARDEMTGNCFK